MILRWWTGADYTPTEIPDDLLRPLIEDLLRVQAWDRNLERLGHRVRDTRLAITDYLLRQAQAIGRPTAAEAVVAEAIVAQAEAAARLEPEPAPAPDRMAAARAAKAAKRAALRAIEEDDGA